MGSQSKKKKITVKFALNTVALLIIFSVALNPALKLVALKISPDFQLVKGYAQINNNNSDFVEFINVGQGDCTLIKSGNAVAIIDFGVEEDGKKIYRRLLKYGIKSIDIAIITHHHSDHMGGFLKVAEKMEINQLVIGNTTAEDGEAQLYNDVLALAYAKKIEVISPAAESIFKIGEAMLKIISHNPLAQEENNRSIITMLSICGKNVLFTGDADNVVELFIADNCNIKCDILKMGHHGSDTSSYTYFLKAALPEIAVASCGYDNSYNHPALEAVQRLKECGIKIYRTDLDRSIRCTFNATENTYTVTTERGETK